MCLESSGMRSGVDAKDCELVLPVVTPLAQSIYFMCLEGFGMRSGVDAKDCELVLPVVTSSGDLQW